jgi:hypothetical protein
MGALEEGGKAISGLMEAMRNQPLVLMMGLMNAGLLVFLWLYMSRITARTEITVGNLFAAQDKLYTQWGTIVKDTNELAEKSLHCVTVDDALKLIRPPPASVEPTRLPLPPLPTLPILRLLTEEYQK